MSTIITHPVVPLALGLGLRLALGPGLRSEQGSRVISTRILLLGCLFSVIPDLDVIGFQLGISYYSPYGHRGFTHSILFAVLCAGIAAYSIRYLSSTQVSGKVSGQASRTLPVFLFLAFSMLSHGVLDAMTFGGRGVGFFWPFVDSREFFPWRPLPVSVIGIERFFKYFDNWGAYVLKPNSIEFGFP